MSALSPPGAFPRGAVLRERDTRREALRWKYRRRRAGVFGVAALLALVGYAISGGGPGGSPRSASGSTRPLPAPSLTSTVAARRVVPGHAAHLPWPSSGQGAVAVLGSGLVGRSPHERSVPIASLTKMMTAYLVLRDHPLELGQAGPRLTMTRSDVADWVHDSQSGDSTLPVRAGEVLSEYQLLEGLLIPSGDNVAELLARWDAGSIPAFVAMMNAEARTLGLDATHYADPSGVDPRSRSTAADQAVLAADLMADPVVRRIVAYPSRPFPVAGTIWNYNPALGTDGIVGVKSGFTSEAQGCLVTAAYRDVGGRSVLVVTAATGQPDGLYGAARADEALLVRASRSLVAYPLASRTVGRARFAWSPKDVPLVAPSLPATVVTWPGTTIVERLDRAGRPVRSAGGAPAVLGELSVTSTGGLSLRVPVVAGSPVPAVPSGWSAG